MPDSHVRFMSVSRPSIPPSFTSKKNAILASLSTPESTYTDLSPKGSIDEAIKSLIDRINALEGIVTTSSCSGRISVFLEGNKKSAFTSGRVEQADDAGGGAQSTKDQVAGPVEKGMGGRWLFVSHQPVHFHTSGASLTRTLGMERLPEGYTIQSNIDITKVRLARFQFEPMILHVMCASLHHAQPILAAAINAGFRESGVQSLKNLDDAKAFPMVAIRSSGLALGSVVGRMFEENESNDVEVHPVISEEYLGMLIQLANERFKTNAERIKRFEEDLFRGEAGSGEAAWEDSKSRQERKKVEGLRRQQFIRKEQALG